jgi:anti-anti-sigma factor
MRSWSSIGRSRAVTLKESPMIASARPSLSTETVEVGVDVVTLDGEFDISHTPQIGYRMSDILGACESDLVIDLRGVCFVDSKMVRTLVHAFKQADSRDCELVLVRPNPLVWRVFEVGGLSEMFPAFHDLRDAVGYLAEAA